MQRKTRTVYFHLNPKNKTNVKECIFQKIGTETHRYRDHSSYQRGRGFKRGEVGYEQRYKLLDIK